MGLFKRLAGFLGLAKEDDQQQQQQEDNDAAAKTSSTSSFAAAAAQGPRKGFSVPVQVPVERGPPPPPLLVFCQAGDGGIQGLTWYSRRLRIDEDGDVADEFLDEVLPDASMSQEEHNRPLPKFEVKYSTKPAKVKNLTLLPDGRIQHLVESQGRLEWV